MGNGRKPRRDGRAITPHPLKLESALSAALKVPSDKPPRSDDKDKKRVEKATEVAIDIYEEALKELEKH